jgi:hypothetical protein
MRLWFVDVLLRVGLRSLERRIFERVTDALAAALVARVRRE